MSATDLQDSMENAASRLHGPVSLSFEFFPPNDAEMERTLWLSLQRLAPLAPRFVSVTYGADGSTRERTHNVVARILNETALTPAPHLTCVGAAREEILEIGVPAEVLDGTEQDLDPELQEQPPHLE